VVTDDSSFLELSLVWKGASCFYGRKHKTGRSSCQVEKYVVCPCIIWRYVLYHQSTLFSVQWCTFCSRRPRNHNPLCVILRGNARHIANRKKILLVIIATKFKTMFTMDTMRREKLNFNISSRKQHARIKSHLYRSSVILNWINWKNARGRVMCFLQMIDLTYVAK